MIMCDNHRMITIPTDKRHQTKMELVKPSSVVFLLSLVGFILISKQVHRPPCTHSPTPDFKMRN